MNYRRSQAKGASFFFTVVTYGRRSILCRKQNVSLIKETFRHVAARHPFRVDAFVILPDHIHCIWTLPDNDHDFSMRWRLIKGRFSRICHDGCKGLRSASRFGKGEQAVWQRRFWEHQLRDDDDFARHVEYIHYNPVKHGLVDAPSKWPHSTFHRYVERGIYDSEWGAGQVVAFDEKIGRE